MAVSPPPAVTADIRRRNLGAVLGCILEAGAIARSDIAAATGLSRAAVTSLVADLVDAGLLRESTAVPAAMGRPRILLEPAADDRCLVTCLLDADHATAVVTGLGGETLVRVERRHGRPLRDPEAIASTLASVLDEAMDAVRRRIADIGVVVWAPVGGDPPVVLADTDLEWGEVDLVALLRARSGALRAFSGPVHLLPDSTVAARAEHAALGSPGSLLYLKSDSGIGGAIVIDQQPPLVLGAALGHLPIIPGGALCLCGQRGCLVTVAGPDALLGAAGMTAIAAGRGLGTALEEFVARVLAGDDDASRAWAVAAGEIARALQITALTVWPDVIMLGGFLAKFAGDVDEAFRSIQPHIAQSPDHDPPRILPSALGRDAALLGAQHAARERLLADPLAL